MAEERKVKRWITVNGRHIPIYEDSQDWMSADMKARYSMFIDRPDLYASLDSDEKVWVEALRAERIEEEERRKQSQIIANTIEANKLNEKEKRVEIKPWSQAEEKRTEEMSRYIINKLKYTENFGEFYEENVVEEIYSEPLQYNGYKDEISMTKMNLVYTQNYDENGRKVKAGKSVTGSTYYLVQTEDGSIDESNFAYKTKADAEHMLRLYVNEWKDRRNIQ